VTTPLLRNEIRQEKEMAKTAAQRQAAYRARSHHAGHDGNGERRLSVWVGISTWLAIARLARRYAVTRRALIERLVLEEEERALAAIELDSPQWNEYFDNKPLRHNGAIREPEQEESMQLPT
jgi:hypothetical protein